MTERPDVSVETASERLARSRAELQQLFVENGREVERFDDFLGLNLRRTIMQFHDNSREALLPERHQRPSANDGLHAGRNGVGEHQVQRHGEGNVAEEGHVVSQ